MTTSTENGRRTSQVTSRLAKPRKREAARDRLGHELQALFEPPLRTVEPTLIVPIGGSGIQTASRLKKLLQEQGTDSYTRILGLDTDETAQTGAPGCPSLADDEFIHVKTGRVCNVIDNPDAHKLIVERTGLDDPDQAAFQERLVHEGKEQAGQVRTFGQLALLSDYGAVKTGLNRSIASLNGVFSALEKQLASKNRVVVRRRMSIIVLCSNGGGTGSSMAMSVTAMLRELTKGLPVDIDLYMMMPSTFDSVMEGKPEQSIRLGANGIATLSEFHAARSGFFKQQRIHLGPDERNEISVPAGLFNQLFLVGPRLADGRSLGSPEAVYDALALHLAAVIGTEIHDRVEAEDANQATLRGLTPDPMTGQSRYVSTVAAQALALPADRIAKHSAAQQMIEFIEVRVIGTSLTADALDAQLDAWKNQPLDSEPLVIDAHELPASLLRICLPNPSSVVRPLYRVIHGSQKLYLRNSLFVQQVERFQTQFKEIQIPNTESKLAELATPLTSELSAAFGRYVNRLAKSHGWDAAFRFCQSEAARLTSVTEQLGAEADSDLAAARVGAAKTKELLTPLQSFFRCWYASKKRQNRVATQVQTTVLAALGSLTKTAAQRIVVSLRGDVLEWQKTAEAALAGANRCLERSRSALEDSRAGRRVTTSSQVELDVSTPATDQRLYADNRLDSALLMERLGKAMQVKSATALRRLVTEPTEFNGLMDELIHYFLGQFASVSVVDVLADQLSDPQTAADAKARISQVVIGCQPMWRAETGQNGVEFADTMLVGVPESTVDAKRSLVVNAIMDAATHRIHANGQYNGRVGHLISGDAHRIYVIRRTHGGCLHYLPEVVRAQADYDQWLRDGGHPVHIFNPRIVMKMPSILPIRSADEGEVAFALGTAYGWIANRGPNWYWNLERSESDSRKFVCRLTSHWNGIAFRGMARVTDSSSVAEFEKAGRLVYEERSDALPTQNIGQGMDEAFQCVCENQEMIELIQDAFAEMRDASGDVRVAEDLELYIANLKQRTPVSGRNAGLAMKMIDVLLYQLRVLRSES